jgi:hypothetical protein
LRCLWALEPLLGYGFFIQEEFWIGIGIAHIIGVIMGHLDRIDIFGIPHFGQCMWRTANSSITYYLDQSYFVMLIWQANYKLTWRG